MPISAALWDVGPHERIPTEPTWQDFVLGLNGKLVSKLLPESETFKNADFIFEQAGVLIELKEIETEFSESEAFRKGFHDLLNRVVSEDPSWRPVLFGGSGAYPVWFPSEFLRLFRPHISRILKKANRQLRETKAHLGIDSPTGVLVLANDGFNAIDPGLIRTLAAQLLLHSYSSIDCLVYITVNRYVELPGSDVPRLLWAPIYSDRAFESLVEFIDDLGRRWFDFLDQKIGPFTVKASETARHDSLLGIRSIVLPGEQGG